MKTADFDYLLPDEMIAQAPAEPRDHSRLMVVSRADGALTHRRFYELPDLVREGDVLVFNDSRVVPARLRGTRDGTGAWVELLLLGRLCDGAWRALVRPGRRMRDGATFKVTAESGDHSLTGEVVGVDLDGSRRVRLSSDDLNGVGVVPLPPYVRAGLEDEERYQTVYSRVEGSVAAPTAGLHFTPDLLDRLRGAGAETVFVTLHVGWDSFRPVKVEEPTDHPMHSEQWTLGLEAAHVINRAKREGRRVVSVGTTAVRLLEQCAAEHPHGGEVVRAGSGWAGLYILPGHRFRVVDALVTNFHLPRSTLLMLTCAFAGRELVLRAYEEAVRRRYRFYSFGDAMLIE